MSSSNSSSPSPSTFRDISNNFVGSLDSSYSYLYATLGNLQLDIVGFLAVLGEGSVLANAQVSTLSRMVYLPRLLPAPQALLRPYRPLELLPEPGKVAGVHSGNERDYVNHIGHMVLDARKMPEYSVRCVEIERVSKNGVVKARTFGPLSYLAVFGCVESLVILGLSIAFRDGMSILAVTLLSFLSSLVGIGNKWELHLHKRSVSERHVPPGDVVIRYPKGNFLVVQCDEEIARELYFAPESIEYLVSNPPAYRLISLLGTLMLMFGVITLANAQVQLQITYAAAYMLLNAAYWVVAALPSKMHWDRTSFRVKKQKFSDSEPDIDTKTYTSLNRTFTIALWKVIVATKSINWVRWTNAAPHSKAWDQWLRDALEVALTASFYMDGDVKVWKVPDWDPQEHLSNLLKNPDYSDITISAGGTPLVSMTAGSDKV